LAFSNAVASGVKVCSTGSSLQPGWLGHQLGHELPLGGYEYGGKIDQVCYGLIGDVRIVARPLPPSAFMIA
jgi:hypothetical protein